MEGRQLDLLFVLHYYILTRYVRVMCSLCTIRVVTIKSQVSMEYERQVIKIYHKH